MKKLITIVNGTGFFGIVLLPNQVTFKKSYINLCSIYLYYGKNMPFCIDMYMFYGHILISIEF